MTHEEDEGIRLNKFLSHNTKYSRREADELIKAGKVKMKGVVIEDLSKKVYKGDKVYLHGKFVHRKNEFTVLVYNKLKGELVTKKDDRGRKTIFDNFSKRYHHYLPVGRLDYASEGLLLLTDSPEVATILMSSDLERVYYVKIRGLITEAMEEAMKRGLHADVATKGAHSHSKIKSMDFKPFLQYKIIKNAPNFSRLKVTISEGQNRELRRFFGYFDAEVTDLKRVEFGGISLDTLNPGKHRFLTKGEYHSLHTYMEGIKLEKIKEKRQEKKDQQRQNRG
jgi:23S rRNA pseudouridine2605 synthase